MKRFVLLPLLFITLVWTAQAHAVSFTLGPTTGTISGGPAATIGWGFTLNNNTDFLVVTGLEIHPSGVDPSLSIPTLGTFTDFLASQYFEVGPGNSSVSQAFDVSNGQGLGSFTINSAAVPGSFEDFTFWLFYDLYGSSPEAGGEAISYGNYLTADARVFVEGNHNTPVPEPSTLILLAGGLLGVGCALRNRRRV